MLEFDPLDEYPIHQIPLPMRYTASGDRNIYDRNIFHGIDRKAEWYFMTGLGVYPNLGVIDAYLTVRHGDRQWVVRTSGHRPEDRMRQQVGPYRCEVVTPFHELRIVCDGDDHGLGCDLTYRSDYGPIAEPEHVRHNGDRTFIQASRFAGVGSWEGELRVAGQTIAVTPERFNATRDRSWGIRPVGEAEPVGRPTEFSGMWWCWVPLRFDDFALHVIIEEDAEGVRSTNLAVREWPVATGRSREQFGWPLPEITYRPGTRYPTAARIPLTGRDGRTSVLEVEPIIGIPLNVGCGYNGDPDWAHGIYKGEHWVEGAEYDHNDPAVAGRAMFSFIDNLARARFEGHEGWGIFEHGCIGPHAPSRFTDFTSGQAG
jgi:hypothetical protein